MSEKVSIGCRIRKDMLPTIDKAIEITGATSYSDFVRDAIREYLKTLSLISERKELIEKKERR